MLKKNRNTLLITSLITVLPILIGIAFYNRLPDPMATHFAMNNEADGFSSKAFAVFGLPLFLLGVQWLCAFVISKDPRKQNISAKLFTLVLWIIPVVSLAGAATTYSYNLGIRVNIANFAQLFLGIVFVLIGNYLPKARQNYTIGIRLPWTLDNEENWNRTHRLGGYVWTIGGVVMILLALLGGSGPLFFVITAVMVLVPSCYSFYLHSAKGL